MQLPRPVRLAAFALIIASMGCGLESGPTVETSVRPTATSITAPATPAKPASYGVPSSEASSGPTTPQAPTATPTAKRISAPVPFPTSTATPLPNRDYLYTPIVPPLQMAEVVWIWDMTKHDREFRQQKYEIPGENRSGIEFLDLIMGITIHYLPEPKLGQDRKNEIYIKLMEATLPGGLFKVGIQTNIISPNTSRGAEDLVILETWAAPAPNGRSTADARWNEEWGSVQSKGRWLQVSLRYNLLPGEYRAWVYRDKSLEDGYWLGLWIEDCVRPGYCAVPETLEYFTWVGSIRISEETLGSYTMHWPMVGSHLLGHSAIEILGDEVQPIDIPEWNVSLGRPILNRLEASRAIAGYGVGNAAIHTDHSIPPVHFQVGSDTSRSGAAKEGEPIFFD